jgi:hypothetical protein
VQRNERLQTRQRRRRRHEGPGTGRTNRGSHFQASREPLRAKTQLNERREQARDSEGVGGGGGDLRDIFKRGGARGYVAARNGLAVGDLERSAADLAPAAAAERQKDAMGCLSRWRMGWCGPTERA